MKKLLLIATLAVMGCNQPNYKIVEPQPDLGDVVEFSLEKKGNDYTSTLKYVNGQKYMDTIAKLKKWISRLYTHDGLNYIVKPEADTLSPTLYSSYPIPIYKTVIKYDVKHKVDTQHVYSFTYNYANDNNIIGIYRRHSNGSLIIFGKDSVGDIIDDKIQWFAVYFIRNGYIYSIQSNYGCGQKYSFRNDTLIIYYQNDRPYVMVRCK